MRIFAVFSVLAIGLLFAACHKNDNANNTESTETYRGVVVKNVCCQIAIQTFGTKNIGESWMDATTSTTPIYANAFKVANPCDFGNHVAGDTISFKIIGSKIQDCSCCAVYTSVPKANYSVRVVK